jgi:F0F1-type ATP synthase assembly protein I
MRPGGTARPGPKEVASSGPRWPGLTTIQSLAVASQFGVTLAVAVGLGLLVGQWLDAQVQTGPLFTFLGVFVGLVSGVTGTLSLYRATLRKSELEWRADHLRPGPGGRA